MEVLWWMFGGACIVLVMAKPATMTYQAMETFFSRNPALFEITVRVAVLSLLGAVIGMMAYTCPCR